jgi:TetR/AcrR family transcriptional repressor of nem operon
MAMARPRNFDRDQVLDIAIDVFRNKGYEGTSAEDLVVAMGIGRQSLYGAFGDKRSLYLEALKRYNASSVAELIGTKRSASPIETIESMLLHFSRHHANSETSACLGVNAICEFGTSDEDVQRITRESGKPLERFLERLLSDAKDNGEIDQTIIPKAAAQFIATTLMGMKVAARGGAGPDALRNSVRYTMRSLVR